MKYLFILMMLFAVTAFSAEEPAIVAETGPDGVQRAEVTAGSYFFRPGHIIVRAGTPVELAIRSESTVAPHNFVMRSPEAGMDLSEPLSNDVIRIIRFTPLLPGKYEFYCDKKLLFFKSHRERGMEGIIEVR